MQPHLWPSGQKYLLESESEAWRLHRRLERDPFGLMPDGVVSPADENPTAVLTGAPAPSRSPVSVRDRKSES